MREKKWIGYGAGDLSKRQQNGQFMNLFPKSSTKFPPPAFSYFYGGGRLLIRDDNAGSVVMEIDNAGRVGIGTESPAAPLDVEGNTNTVAQVRTTSSTNSAAWVLGTDAGNSVSEIAQNGSSDNNSAGANSLNIIQGQNAPLALFTNSSERMRISGAGDVGIGQSSPSEKLEVKDGNLLLSNSGTAGILKLQGTGSGVSTFAAGAQGSTTINYTLPTTAPSTNDVLTATSVSGSSVGLGWSSGGGSSVLFARRTTDTAYTSTSLWSDNTLHLSLSASSTYTFEGFLSFEDVNQDMSSGAKIAFTVPSGTVKFGVNSSGGPLSGTPSIENTSGTALTGIVIENGTAGDETFVYVKGIAVVGTTAGDLQLKCAKGNGTSLKLHTNSYITATKVQ